MIIIKIILLILLLYAKLCKADSDLVSDEFSDVPDGDDLDMFLIAGGIPIDNAGEKFDKSIVSIRTSRPTLYFGDNHFCAGTLIGSNLVVTAAHCVTDQNRVLTRAKRLFVVAGSSTRLKRLRTTKEFKVSKIHVHKDYVRKKSSDIAILRLDDAVPPSNDKIKIASLLNTDVKEGTNCSILGWGQLFRYGPYVNKLLFASLLIMPQSACQKYYPKGYGKDLICAVSLEKRGASTCRGDTGGPLFCPDQKGIQRLAGIVAWSYECSAKKPSIFTSIKYHYSWIRETSSSTKMSSSASIILITTFVMFYMTDT